MVLYRAGCLARNHRGTTFGAPNLDSSAVLRHSYHIQNLLSSCMVLQCFLGVIKVLYTFTFMHLADTRPSVLQGIQVIHFLSVHVFPGN